MNHGKLLVLVASLVLASTGFSASAASATTLEVGGTTTNASVSIAASVKSATKLVIKDTAGFVKNECGTSNLAGSTASPFSGSSVTGALSELTFTSCARTVKTAAKGSFEVTYTSGTNGTVASEGTIVEWGSSIGTLFCETGTTTNIGTLFGITSGSANLAINAVMDCGIIPSAKWEGTYIITSPSGLGVSS
jgi:hypothetical protein